MWPTAHRTSDIICTIRILFKFGCKHSINGCTSDGSYAILVTEFVLNKIVYKDAMPEFSSYDDCISNINKYKVIWKSTCKAPFLMIISYCCLKQ